MNFASQHDTIVAIATPPGTGGIGVVRLSGDEAQDILEHIWRGKTCVEDFEPRKLYYGEVLGKTGTAIDQVMAVFMPAPYTYTGEDIVEISCHGSPLLLQQVVEAAMACGARHAEPGEFTKRAFLNGKLDLSQAEAVASLIHATSDQAAKLAKRQLEGRLSSQVESLHDRLTKLRAFVEATVDFPEDDVEFLAQEGVLQKLAEIEVELIHLAQSFEQGSVIRDGVRVALIGKPNAGKSSLLNHLAGYERAIVHHEPGTTRDTLELSVSLNGILFHLVDTAGLRTTGNTVEGIGVERSLKELQRADIVLVLIDGSEDFADDEFELYPIHECANILFAFTKSDLQQKIETENIFHLCANKLSTSDSALDFIHVSAKTGFGMKQLTSRLAQVFSESFQDEASGAVVTSKRHKDALEKTISSLAEAKQSLQNQESVEFAAHHLRLSQESLGRIIGRDFTEDMLDAIFSEFCIGK